MISIHVQRATNYAIIGSDNGLSPVMRQVITCIKVGILSAKPLETKSNARKCI